MTGANPTSSPVGQWIIGRWLGLSRLSLALGAAGLLLGIFSILAPLFIGMAATPLIGFSALVCAACEGVQGMRATSRKSIWSIFVDAGLMLLVGILLFIWPAIVFDALSLLLGIAFAVTGGVRLWRAWRGQGETGRLSLIAAGGINLLLAVLLWTQWPVSGFVLVSILVGVYIFTTGLSMLSATEAAPGAAPEMDGHPDTLLGLPPNPHVARMRRTISTYEDDRWSVDLFWQITLLLTFFAIHLGRMPVDWTLVGMLSPLVAVVGDIAAALLLSLTIIMPVQLLWRRFTRPIERRAWNWLPPHEDPEPGQDARQRMTRFLLYRRLLLSERIRRSTTSPAGILHRGLNLGLPVVAVLIAISPMWGFTWYFNSENWVAAVWEHWAAHRTDDWRQSMVRAVALDADARGISPAERFAIHPPGAERGDFAFLVIGDPGEGDASQYSLKHQILARGEREEVRFLVVSSDVVYPAGAMRDYEPKFYMPFKGFTKPIYAIPGNHDWFDALEGFIANFFEPEAARVAMQARVEADHRLTSTNERRIEALVREAARLRMHYGMDAAHQRAPFFEMHVEGFSLIAVDTGILRSIDEAQEEWLRAALRRAGGRFTMVILGHPFYAAGRYQAGGDDAFAWLYALLREHDVRIVMAGDTHDLEYYREPPVRAAGRPMHHFVNGGGGAYLSIGTALNFPITPAVPDGAYYPRTDELVAKLDAQTSIWNRPIWFWVRQLNAWPSSPEAIAAAFDFNRAPFFQSFVEVRVEPSANRVRILPFGTAGQLRWRDLQVFGDVIPPEAGLDDPAEFVVPMRP